MQQQMQPVLNPVTGQMVPVPPPPPPPPELLQKAAAAIEAQMIEQVMQQLSPQQGEDPLVALQQRDLDIREKAVQLKAEEAALRIDLDERKLEAKQAEEERRRGSMEDIQQLRANVSMARAREAKRPPQ
jgi:F0F1-type ATP synthase epsilon subunit